MNGSRCQIPDESTPANVSPAPVGSKNVLERETGQGKEFFSPGHQDAVLARA